MIYPHWCGLFGHGLCFTTTKNVWMFSVVDVFFSQFHRRTLRHSQRGERALFKSCPLVWHRTWHTVNHPLVMFAFLPHTHTFEERVILQLVLCLNACASSSGRVVTFPFWWLWPALLLAEGVETLGRVMKMEKNMAHTSVSVTVVTVFPKPGDDECIHHITNEELPFLSVLTPSLLSIWSKQSRQGFWVSRNACCNLSLVLIF